MDNASWSGLQGLMFTARRLVDGLYAGDHASTRRGWGLEFYDYRPYVPGDDPAGVDWKVFGRTDRYYIRRFRRHTDLQLYLLVDASASMNFTGADPRGAKQRAGQGDPPMTKTGGALTKLEYAKWLAAAIAMLTIRQGDRVGLGLFDRTLHTHVPISGTWGHLQRVIRTLEEAKPGVGAGDSGGGLAHAHRLVRPRTLVVVISDLLDDPTALFDGFGRLRHDQSDAVVFQVLTDAELDVGLLAARRGRRERRGRRGGRGGGGRFQLVDAETRRQVPTHIPTIERQYAQLMREHIEAIHRGCAARQVDHNLVRTSEAPVEALRRYLARKR